MWRRCLRILLADGVSFIPSSIPHLPDMPGSTSESELQPKLQRESALAARKGYRPLSLKAREELSALSEDKIWHRVTPEWAGLRVDDFLSQQYPDWNYSALTRLVQQGHIYRYQHDGRRKYTRLTDRMELDELIVVPSGAYWQNQIAPPVGVIDNARKPRREFVLSRQVREEALSWVLYKNEHVVVFNKPSGVPVLPGKGIDLNITDMLPCWKYTYTSRPLICNHMDRETSGCVVLARSHNAYRMLGRMFMKRVVPNTVYWTVVVGATKAKFGRIRMHLESEKVPGGDQVIARASPSKNSRVAIAEYVSNFNIADFGSFVSFYPLTSRRHQMRIMAAHALRCPILGDGMFGGEAAFPRSLGMFLKGPEKSVPLHLHHRKIQLPYKRGNGEFVCITAPLPKHMEQTFKIFGLPTDMDDPLIPG